ncbi:hypothetical protein [Hyphomonas sp.]|uniref:hypothetical protein n=1 Tax=Hyphomonas sp. TaxID=87 RepID=UPI0025BF4D66|nr:hypothetical protein [Hyphomonas sp.]
MVRRVIAKDFLHSANAEFNPFVVISRRSTGGGQKSGKNRPVFESESPTHYALDDNLEGEHALVSCGRL